MSKRVWIAQCLCPDRHAILANAGEAETEQEAEQQITTLRETIAVLLDADFINPWCGICNAKPETWHYEVRRTPFETMAEAMPALQVEADKNALAAAVFGDTHETDKPN